MSQQQSLGYQNAISADKRTRNPNWTDGEISRFLEILLEEPVLRDLKEQRNKQVFCYVSRKMFSEGSEKSWDQCKIKLKNLKSQWRYVRDRVPLLETTDLEDDAALKLLMNECQNNGVSPFCVKHLRGLKRFLDSMSAIKRGFQLPVYGPLEPILPLHNLPLSACQVNPLALDHYPQEEEEIAPVDVLEARVKTEEDDDEEEEADEPLIVDFPEMNESASAVTMATITRISKHLTPPSQINKDESITSEDNSQDSIKTDGPGLRKPNLWVKSPSLINKDESSAANGDHGTKRKRTSTDNERVAKVVCLSPSVREDALTEKKDDISEKARVELMARLQENLAEKFLRFQKESDIRHLNWEREQARLEQSFVEKWRLEHQALLERWREDQRNHEREMLNMFTTFLSQTNKLFINKS